MDSIVVHPVEGSSWDSLRMEFSFRLRVIDAVTGELVQGAYAEKPVPDKKVLEARGVHPFRVLKDRDVEFTDDTKVIDVKFKVRTLRVFVKDDEASTGGKKALKEDWPVAPEFFQPHTDKEILTSADGNTVFVHIDAPTEQYVRLKEPSSAPYAERALITDRNGMLLIPLTFREWITGTTLTLKFRDWVILEAKNDFSTEKLMDKETKAGGPVSNFGHKAMKIALEGEPLTNTWTATVGTTKGTFQNEISVATEWGSRAVIDLTVWALRRIKRLSDVMPAADIANGTGTNSRAGIMIHYNGGYFMSELRPDEGTTVHCREAYTKKENRYMMDVKIAMGILKHLNGASGTYGYHYNIEQEGTIFLAVAENLRISHAGFSREKSPVDAIENVDTNPRNATHTISSPKTNLNSSYIGIDVLGYHVAGYTFSAHQHWYLDRLIENIRSRITTLPWYRIQGHDEVRAAYNAVAATPADAKTDPGAAIDGMARLRGRHGATFP